MQIGENVDGQIYGMSTSEKHNLLKMANIETLIQNTVQYINLDLKCLT